MIILVHTQKVVDKERRTFYTDNFYITKMDNVFNDSWRHFRSTLKLLYGYIIITVKIIL